MSVQADRNYKLSPSDLTFLYEGCKHCFVLKVRHGISQPSIPLPGVFSTIAALQKDYYSEKRTEEFCPQLPPGTVKHGEKWVESKPFKFPDCENTCYIKGRFDIVIELDNQSYVVADFKTGKPSAEKSDMYARQLHAYTYALENPAQGALSLSPVCKLGLLYFTPDSCLLLEQKRQILEGDLKWIEVKRDDESFCNFMHNVITLLDGPTPPPDIENCGWCKFRKLTGGLLNKESGETNFTSPLPTCPDCGGPMQLKSGKYGNFWSCMKYPECKGTKNV